MFGNSTIDIAKNFGLITPLLWFLAILAGFGIMWICDQLWADIATMPFGIIGFFGNQGRGKTFTMVTYARRWRRKHPHAPVYTNMYKLLVPGNGPVFTACDLDTMMQAEDALVLIDEAGVFINAWEWISGKQREFALWAAATRHNGNLILVTAHAPEQLNIRVQKVLAELHFLESFQGIKLFRSYVYESFAGMKKANKTKTVWIPKWPTTCRSYDTQMLRKHLGDLQTKTGLTDVQLLEASNMMDETTGLYTQQSSSSALNGKQTTTRKSLGKATTKALPEPKHGEPEHQHDMNCAVPRVLARHAERDRMATAKRLQAVAIRDKIMQRASS